MASTPESERKKTLENGLNNENDETGTVIASEEDPCLPLKNKKTKSVESIKDKNDFDNFNADSSTIDGKQSNTNDNLNRKSIKSKSSSNGNKKKRRFNNIKISAPKTTVFEKRLQEKTGLSRIGLVIAGIILIILLILIFTVLIMSIFWPRIPHSQLFPVCRRSSCLKASAEVLPKMNLSIEPCEDFRSFTCGSWLTSTPMPKTRSEWGLKRKLQYDYRERIRHLITTLPYPTKTTSLGWKIKYWYESCMALENIEVDEARPLRRIFTELGGWYVLRDFTVHSWDLKRTLEQLHSQYGVDAFLEIRVVPDARDTQIDIIQISPASLGLPDRSYYTQSFVTQEVEAYKRYLRDAALQLGGTSHEAGIFSEAIFGFEKRIVENLPDMSTSDPLQQYNRMTVVDLKNLAPAIPLHDILRAKFTGIPIEESTEIIVPSPEYLKSISYLISTTDHSALNNYMIWTLAAKYLPYLSEKFRNTYSLFRKDMFGEEEPVERWEMCVTTLQKFISFGLAAMLQRNSKTFDNEYKVVNEMFEEILANVKGNIRGASNINQDLRDHLLDKVSGLGLQVGFPNTLIFDHYLEDFYRHLYVQRNDFFQNIRYGIQFLQEFEQRRLSTPLPEYRWMNAMTEPGTVVQYVVSANKVLVPLAVLLPPYFDYKYPLAVLYGGLGVEIASAIVSSLAPWNILYAGDGTLLVPEHPAIEQIRHSVIPPFYCLQGYLTRQSTENNPVRNQTVFHSLITISAVKQAFQALHHTLSRYPHTHQPGLEVYENEAIFFITYSQSICVVKSPKQKVLDDTFGNRLDDTSLLTTVLAQSNEFTSVFSCSANSKHYSDQPCEEIIKPNSSVETRQFCVLKHCLA
ncbi:endothelin-converting enzyme homolog [Lycorma delicatula]|uniref:endothelin-converting enzyme homolog n=1 Tax=Lycorma delicatula TaxID=130591 RepID=UPI003F50DFF9